MRQSFNGNKIFVSEIIMKKSIFVFENRLIKNCLVLNDCLGMIKRKMIIIKTNKFIENNYYTSNIATTDILMNIIIYQKKSIYIKMKKHIKRRKQKIKKFKR